MIFKLILKNFIKLKLIKFIYLFDNIHIIKKYKKNILILLFIIIFIFINKVIKF